MVGLYDNKMLLVKLPLIWDVHKPCCLGTGGGGGPKIAYCMAFFKWLAYIKYEGFLQELEMAFVFAVKISIYIVCFEEFCFFISKH